MTVRGKLPDRIPLFRGHTAAVLDTDWNPFDDDVLASSSDDGKIAIWKIPKDYTLFYEDPEEIKDISPIKKLSGHNRKVGHILWHPVAENILASSSADYTIKIWNVETGDDIFTLPHTDLVTSFSFNYDGSLLATVSRDKKIRVWDIRAEKIISEGAGHGGSKASRITWLGPYDRLVTTGFSRLSDRQYALWDSTDVSNGPIGNFHYLDDSSGICVPFFDDSTNCLYLAGKGDGNIRYFEFENDQFFPLSEYQSTDPQRGLAFLPKRAVNVKEHEVVRIYKSTRDTAIEPISFIVPRRAETFQGDVYPPAYAGIPALTAEEWISGKNSPPKVFNMESLFDGSSADPVTASPSKEIPKAKEIPPSPKPASKTSSSSAGAATSSPKAVAPTSSSSSSEKKDIDGLLNGSKHVNNLLAKAGSSEDPQIPDRLKDEESSWDNEPKDTSPPKKLAPAPKIEETTKSNKSINNNTNVETSPSPSPRKSTTTTTNNTTTITPVSKPVEEIKKEILPKTPEPTTPIRSTTAAAAPASTATATTAKITNSTTAKPATSTKATTDGNTSASSASSSNDELVKVVKNLDSKLQILIDELKIRDGRIETLELRIADLLEKK